MASPTDQVRSFTDTMLVSVHQRELKLMVAQNKVVKIRNGDAQARGVETA